MGNTQASVQYQTGRLPETLEFLKRTRGELSQLRMVRVWKHRLEVIDVNGDCFEVRDLGYLDEDIVPVLNAVNTVFKPESIHAEIEAEYKEFKTGRRYPWAADRVM